MKHKAMQKGRFCSMRILFFSLTILFVCASNSYAQSTVNGVVIDATGLPLPGDRKSTRLNSSHNA